MERLQQQMPLVAPNPARRGMSPASHSSNSSTSSKPSLLHRRRESSVPRYMEDHRMSAAKNISMPPPLSVHTQPSPPVSQRQDKRGRQPEPKSTPVKEARKFDRDSLPSMVKANTAHEPSNLKMVSFATSPTTADRDGDQSDTSSICHSPTWDDYGKKKKKDVERKRLTKGPPPAAMDNRPATNLRALSDPLLSSSHARKSIESSRSIPQLGSKKTEEPPIPQSTVQAPPVETVEEAPRSPAFIGGVRLEREREQVLKRLQNARTPSTERPMSEMLAQNQVEVPTQKIDPAKKRATAPYPPTSSKTPFLPPQPAAPARTRRSSIGQNIKAAAGKLFSSGNHEDQPLYKKNESQESIQTVSSWFTSDRGRKMSGDTLSHGRGQSYDSHDRSVTPSSGKKRGRISLPPVSWKNKHSKARTTSMIVVTPDSSRRDSFSPLGGEGSEQDNFGFLERPFSPPVDQPLSPPGSLPASMKAKMSPRTTPSPAPSAALQHTSKKTLKDRFRSSSATPEPRLTRKRSGTNDTLVGSTIEIPLPPDSYASHGHLPGAQSEKSSPALSSKAAPHFETQRSAGPIGKAHAATRPKDSGDSSSSSHPETESQPPSPMTTPSNSRPQSSKDNQTLRIDDLKQMPMFSHDASNYTMTFPGMTALGTQSSGFFGTKKPELPRVTVESTTRGSKVASGRPRTKSGSNFTEDLPGSHPFLTDEFYPGSKKPLDPDQLSFTSALTSLDVKKSFTDLDSAVNSFSSPNADVPSMSLGKDQPSYGRTKVTNRTIEVQIKKAPKGAAGSVGLELMQASDAGALSKSPKTLSAGFSPTPSQQALPPWVNGRASQGTQPYSNAEERSLVDSTDSLPRPTNKASTYLQEARKAAPQSPRAPPSKAGRSASPSGSPTSTALAGPRSFLLSGPTTKPPATPGSPLSAAAVAAQVRGGGDGASGILDKPMAKMLVECCHCRFYHDMPSRVYEAMARPDDVVKDKKLGVSGQVTTCVKCPWCAHNMSTVCCAGYAAVVYLKEKMHGP